MGWDLADELHADGEDWVLRSAAENRIAELEQWQRDMVAKAADKSLDGYRELGARCAELEKDKDRLKNILEAWARSDGGAGGMEEISAAIDAAREGK